jgi:RNA polymerase sigma-70 factor (ECF subfamily)
MHLALNELEHEKRLVQSVLDTDEYDPEREVLLQRMEQAIELLPEQDRQIIRLHYYEQKKTDEIARFTGLTQTNVLVRLHRIRERLRRTLGEDEEINRIQ